MFRGNDKPIWLTPTRSPKRDSLSATRVLVAESDRHVLSEIRAVLEAAPGVIVCGEAETAVTAIARALQHRPDICLVSMELPGGGTRAVWEISGRLPLVKLLMLTASFAGRGLTGALAAGASGYVLTTGGFDRLPLVLTSVIAGEVAIPRASVAALVAELRDGRARRRTVIVNETDPDLTSREWQVLQLLCDGQGTVAMSRHLGITQATVRSHVANALRKLDVNDRESAIAAMNPAPTSLRPDQSG
jgi:two-component system, NarL family, nitrate/nitrite response regulator NarL